MEIFSGRVLQYKWLKTKYAKKICDSFLATRFSVGASHKKSTTNFQESLGSQQDNTPQKDKRNVIQKYITQRGKPSYEE